MFTYKRRWLIVVSLLGVWMLTPMHAASAGSVGVQISTPDHPDIFIPEGGTLPADLGVWIDGLEVAIAPLLPWIDADGSLDGVDPIRSPSCSLTAFEPFKASGGVRGKATYICDRVYTYLNIAVCVQIYRGGQWEYLPSCHAKGTTSTDTVSVRTTVKCVPGTHKYRTKASANAADEVGVRLDNDRAKSLVVTIKCN